MTAYSTSRKFKGIFRASGLERILAVKGLVILGPTKRKVSGGNLPFPDDQQRATLQHKLPFTPSNMYSHFRPKTEVHSTIKKATRRSPYQSNTE